MKLYLAGPLFTLPEREFNVRLARALEHLGHETWLPQEKSDEGTGAHLTPKDIFLRDKQGCDWCDVLVGNMDGADPDSGTCWEQGYVCSLRKQTILYRTDFRGRREKVADGFSNFNLMMEESADRVVILDVFSQDFDTLVRMLNNALFGLQAPKAVAHV
jgi:nucleoside 2-deoxyribosyltransferase